MLASLPEAERQAALDAITPAAKAALSYFWPFWARPNQLIPQGEWTHWLILAGRGFGKTRTGAETVRNWARTTDMVNLIGATVDDARDIMIEGESGILAICPASERPEYKKSERKLVWPNGATSLIFTADEPERLRGKQHKKLWADEVAAWRYPDAWDQAMFGLRLGDTPQSIVTTTPRPVKIVRELVNDAATHITRGTTYENRGNLAPQFFKLIIGKYEGTRLGRQELDAELLEDLAGALWTRSMFDRTRVREAPELKRIVVAVDPSGTKGLTGVRATRAAKQDAISVSEGNNDIGIIVAGIGRFDNRGYVLADLSCNEPPQKWGEIVVNAFHHFKADRIVEGSTTPASLMALLGEVESIATKSGRAVIAVPALPSNIEALSAWEAELAQRGIVIAPVSALINGSN